MGKGRIKFGRNITIQLPPPENQDQLTLTAASVQNADAPENAQNAEATEDIQNEAAPEATQNAEAPEAVQNTEADED